MPDLRTNVTMKPVQIRLASDHSPFLMPNLRHQLLVTLAQRWFLICTDQSTTFQKKLRERWAAR